jgi:hypothetical protein
LQDAAQGEDNKRTRVQMWQRKDRTDKDSLKNTWSTKTVTFQVRETKSTCRPRTFFVIQPDMWYEKYSRVRLLRNCIEILILFRK